jgi:hypothetical protein
MMFSLNMEIGNLEIYMLKYEGFVLDKTKTRQALRGLSRFGQGG